MYATMQDMHVLPIVRTGMCDHLLRNLRVLKEYSVIQTSSFYDMNQTSSFYHMNQTSSFYHMNQTSSFYDMNQKV